ncbi:hypothetical protein [Salibacterium qingdaonense]|uniref:Uncharacterized protein n=1 Tax=Salibacterium qingdaonense TaxID=266892 RepID=A0A1I4QW75_9BACI|nr:hypothetical protein [Salibacterium qingdaonense]SFM44247.1 hypothetical protein SAMN04488054_15114 [Salibacterium qingdaonense]
MLITDIQTFMDKLDELPRRLQKRVEDEWKPVDGFNGADIQQSGDYTSVTLVTLDWVIDISALKDDGFVSSKSFRKVDIIHHYDLIMKIREELKNENT